MFYKVGVLKNTCAGVSVLIIIAILQAGTLLRKRFWHICFSNNFVKFLRRSIFYNASELRFLHFEEVIIQNDIKKVLPTKISFEM